MTVPTLVDTLHATNAVVAGQILGDVIQGDVRRPEEFVRDFDLESATGFVGRDDVFAQLDAFAQHAGGYFEIVGEAGLGKTAVAIEIARRRAAVVFLASASSGLQRPEQFLTHVTASLIVRHGLGYRTLPARAGEDATYLVRILRESVQRAGPVWLVVDGLDEAEAPPAGSNPLLLPPALPPGVFVVLTRRAGELVRAPNTPWQRYRLRRDDPQQIADIDALVRGRVTGQDIRNALAASVPPVTEDAFAAQLVAASEGNFMYVSYVLADVAAHEPGTPLDLTALPFGLTGYYEQFWARMTTAQQSWAEWEALFQPVIERLTVAAEPVTADWLARQVGRSAAEIRARVLDPWTRVLGHALLDGQPTWRLVHRSFADYLEGRLDLTAAHRAVADHYCQQRWDQFDTWDDYGLRHAATHLAAVARRTPEAARHAAVARLVRLVTEHRFQRAHLDQLRDPTLLRRDLETAHELVASDPDPDATFLLVLVALTLVRFRRQMLRPDAVFDAARRGDLLGAQRLLDLFGTDLNPEWHDAIQLCLAWLAPTSAQSDRKQADRQHVRETVAGGPTSPILARLLEHVDAALDGAPAPVIDLPPPANSWEADMMVARLAGLEASSLTGGIGELLGGGGYLATQDGPPLVALANHEPSVGEPILQRYLAVHQAYGYREYRDRSLWELLGAVLRHPRPEWVRDWLARLSLVVLAAPDRGEFLEGLEIAVLALQSLAGDPAATAELDTRRTAALDDARKLPSDPGRGQGDAWAIYKRRLATLAEAYSRLPAGMPLADELALAALNIAPGFAGFAAPASLTLAETLSLVRPTDLHCALGSAALDSALTSAHHIQDPTFCARTTARVNAMRDRWWPTPRGASDRLVREPSAAEFGTVHTVGEQYVRRDPGGRFRLPPLMLTADTLAELAEVYQRPLPAFLAHNPGLPPDQPLPAGARINVPDPGFPPLLAARLSADLLAQAPSSAAPAGAAASATMRHLAPISAVDLTANCTVLTRLLLCAPTHDAQTLAELLELVRQTTAQAAQPPTPSGFPS